MASGPGVDWRVGLVDPTTGVPVTGFPSTVADGANVVEGTTTDAAVGDASGTLNAHLRQTAKALAGGLPAALVGGRLSVDGSGVTQPTSAASGQFVDGAITTLGANADAAVGDATGTLNAHLRQVAKSLAGTLTTTGADTTASGSLAANNAATTLATVGMAAATFQIATDVTWNGTLNFEASNDNSNWIAVDAINVSTGLRGPTYTTANTNALFRVTASGLAKVRVRVSPYVAGTATITAEAGVGAAQYGQFVQGSQFAGATVAQSPVIVGMNGSSGIRYLTEANSVFPTTGNAVLGVGPGVWDATNWQKMLGDTSGRQQVVGAAAIGAAIAGNPVLMGASDGTNTQAALVDTQKNLMVTLRGTNTTNATTVQALGDTANNGNGLIVFAGQELFNGNNWDRQRNNVDVTLLASAGRTTLQNSANILTYNCKGIIVTVDVTATVSTVSLTPSINYIDPASGKTIPLLTGTTIAATGTFTYWVDEAALASVAAPFTKTAQAALGRIITINMAVGNANSQTYSIGYTIIP